MHRFYSSVAPNFLYFCFHVHSQPNVVNPCLLACGTCGVGLVMVDFRAFITFISIMDCGRRYHIIFKFSYPEPVQRLRSKGNDNMLRRFRSNKNRVNNRHIKLAMCDSFLWQMSFCYLAAFFAIVISALLFHCAVL